MGCQGAINGISFTYHEPDLTRPTSAPIQQQQQVQEEDPEKNETKENDETKENVGIYPSKSTLEGEEFVVNDFSVSTNRAQYLYFKTNGSQATVRENIQFLSSLINLLKNIFLRREYYFTKNKFT